MIYVPGVIGVFMIVIGRIFQITTARNLTEAQALIEFWFFWLSGAVLIITSWILIWLKKK